MSVKHAPYIPSLLGLLLLGHSAQALDNASLNGCYVTSLSGNTLGPQVTVDATGQLVPDAQTLVLHGTASVGRLCFDGQGNVTELIATQNIAGLCAVPYTGTGTYEVDPANGMGTASLSTTIPSDAVLPPTCAVLDVQAGDKATFGFSFVLDGQGCAKILGLNAVTEAGPIPLVTEGEACPQMAQ